MKYDSSKKQNFKLHAVVLWTIIDLLAYVNLFGWATYINLAYLVCKLNTHYSRLKMGESVRLWATDVLYHLIIPGRKLEFHLMENKS